MKRVIRFAVGSLVCACATAFVLAGAGVSPAEAQPKTKSTKTEAKFVSYDDASKTMTVRVLKPGDRPKNAKLAMRPGKEAKFRIQPEGSVLVRTSVTADGMKSSIGEIPADKTLNIYWVPDEQDPNGRFARKIDMVYTDEELEARDKKRLEEERAKGKVADE
jgi:hypothetical protein